MIKCVIFDLDNTLFDQVEYIKNLMNYISSLLSKKYNLDKGATSKLLISYWLEKGPFYGRFFDDIVGKLSINKDEVQKLIDISHSYQPKVSTYPRVITTLNKLMIKKYRLALITDGNPTVQKNKINALGLKKYFAEIFYAAGQDMKPSPKAYIAVLNNLKINPQEAVYVGDNPNVDFITPKKMKMTTIRVRTGYFKNLKLDNWHEADYTINNLAKIFNVLDKAL